MRSEYTATPEGLSLHPAPDGFVIRRKWLGLRTLVIALFVIPWDCFIVYLYAKLAEASDSTTWTDYVFFPHLAFGLLATYYLFASFINTTEITLSEHTIRVRSGPAPWIGNRIAKASEVIDILFIQNPTNSLWSYSVWSVDRRQWKHKLVWFVPEKEQADFIAATLRQFLALNGSTESLQASRLTPSKSAKSIPGSRAQPGV